MFTQIIEWMAGQVKPDRRQFAVEPLGRDPGFAPGDGGALQGAIGITPTEQAGLGTLALLGRVLRH